MKPLADDETTYYQYLSACDELEEKERYARGHNKSPRTKTERKRLSVLKKRLVLMGFDMSPDDIIG